MSEERVNFYGKVAKMPRNIKAKNAYNFLENIKVDKKKLWYILIEKDENELQCIKYNNKMGVDLTSFVKELAVYYKKDSFISGFIEKLIIEGNDKFSIIKNIPDVEVTPGKKMISFLTENLIQLLK
jgi:hypothetical protein